MYASTKPASATCGSSSRLRCSTLSVVRLRKIGRDGPKFSFTMVASHATRQSTVRGTAYNPAVPVPEILCEFAPVVPDLLKPRQGYSCRDSCRNCVAIRYMYFADKEYRVALASPCVWRIPTSTSLFKSRCRLRRVIPGQTASNCSMSSEA